MKNLPNIWLFWTGGEKYGEWWSGINKILENFWTLWIKDSVSIIVSNNWNGWVKEKAYNNWVLFEKFKNYPSRWEDWTYSEKDKEILKDMYIELVEKHNLDFVFLSWWNKYVDWLEPNKTINIHPGPLVKPYWWEWKYWNHIHKKIWEDYEKWQITKTCVTMHYVTEEFDKWPIIAQIPVELSGCESWEDVKQRTNTVEHIIQSKVTLMIMEWKISWSWIEWEPVQFPEGFKWWEEVDLN